jgi:DNA-directed RNA polymerase subunit H (RpoH/RPB5)
MDETFERLCTLRGYLILEADKGLVYDPRTRCRVQLFYVHQAKLDMSYFYKAYEHLAPEVTHLIFVYAVATIQIKKLKLYKDVLKIEFFQIHELQRLLRGNRLVPPHRALPADEADLVRHRFGATHLPQLLQSDPIARLYDFPVGAVVEVDRPTGVYYRLVIAADD